MNKVIVAERNGKYDAQAAQEFGKLNFVFGESLASPWDFQGNASYIRSYIEEIGFDPSSDYICLSGHQNIISVLLAVMSKMFPSGLQILVYHAGTKKYLKVEFNND